LKKTLTFSLLKSDYLSFLYLLQGYLRIYAYPIKHRLCPIQEIKLRKSNNNQEDEDGEVGRNKEDSKLNIPVFLVKYPNSFGTLERQNKSFINQNYSNNEDMKKSIDFNNNNTEEEEQEVQIKTKNCFLLKPYFFDINDRERNDQHRHSPTMTTIFTTTKLYSSILLPQLQEDNSENKILKERLVVDNSELSFNDDTFEGECEGDCISSSNTPPESLPLVEQIINQNDKVFYTKLETKESPNSKGRIDIEVQSEEEIKSISSIEGSLKNIQFNNNRRIDFNDTNASTPLTHLFPKLGKLLYFIFF
jgi:hypothetical protein